MATWFFVHHRTKTNFLGFEKDRLEVIRPLKKKISLVLTGSIVLGRWTDNKALPRFGIASGRDLLKRLAVYHYYYFTMRRRGNSCVARKKKLTEIRISITRVFYLHHSYPSRVDGE